MMDVRPLHTNEDYEWALGEIARYFDNQPAPGSDEGDRFEVLSTLIKAYEDTHIRMPYADPIDVLHFAIESMGKTQADLANIIGRNRASEILNRVRPLTLDMIRSISKEWNIPVESLTAPYELVRQHA
ncbi:HTH-type transcriptional regulator/antitoxin HigA [Nitrobacteraceae bacterium AZCC 1564]